MARLSIDRLILEVEGWNEPDARELAIQVIDRIAGGVGSASGGYSGRMIRIDLEAPADSSKGRLASDVAERILEQVRLMK